eukprot:CAMPEP_0177588412 /NCGR_PEP_ID=MMETSP0419_2-20121207/6210_1 /TAXON_ID=582737 /ORGANISM="Tetraselmis sp., Strain GSL018" /LENGTH=272 /DNA_ID=CAMNT_0019078605 /DNA_START=1590 /DNA_END=2409 /DNA_ORIENTATION=-
MPRGPPVAALWRVRELRGGEVGDLWEGRVVLELVLRPQHHLEQRRQLRLLLLALAREDRGVELARGLLALRHAEELRDGARRAVVKGEQRHRPFELLQERGVLLAAGREVLLRKLQRVVGPPDPDELDEPLLLQVEEELLLLLQDLGIEVVDPRDGLVDVACLDSLADLHSVRDRIEVDAGRGARLLLKRARGLHVALCHEKFITRAFISSFLTFTEASRFSHSSLVKTDLDDSPRTMVQNLGQSAPRKYGPVKKLSDQECSRAFLLPPVQG